MTTPNATYSRSLYFCVVGWHAFGRKIPISNRKWRYNLFGVAGGGGGKTHDWKCERLIRPVETIIIIIIIDVKSNDGVSTEAVTKHAFGFFFFFLIK